VLKRIGGRNQIFAYEKGWKDTVLIMPREKVSVIMTFPLYVGKFVFHCHNLEHEDDGMMLNYTIV
jgi:FtsP/CotA-like multicopper oxidase with cupredoxin domain